MPYTLSPTSLRLFSDCPRCFYRQVKLNLYRPGKPFPTLPSGIDKHLKERFDYYRGKGKLPPELRQIRGIKLCEHPLLALWKDHKQGLRWKDPQGNVLWGAVDDVLEKDGQFIVLEFSTRGFPLKEDTASFYDNQINIYTYLLQKNGFSTMDYAYLLFYYPKSISWKGDVWFHKELLQREVSMEKAEKLFSDAKKVLDGSLPPASQNCQFCQWEKKVR